MTMKAPHRLPRGCTFYPEQNELTDLYLRCKITGQALPGDNAHFIHDADVYSAEPEKLVEKFHKAPGTGEGDIQKQPVWYFFSPVRHASVGRKTNARGVSGRKARKIDGEGDDKCWHSEYGERPVKGGSEFGGNEQRFTYKVRNASSSKYERAGWIMTEYGISPEHGGGDLVLCEIHPSPRTPGSDSSKKRKVAADEHLEDPRASARPRHMVDRQDEQDSWSKIYESLPLCNDYDQEVDAQPEAQPEVRSTTFSSMEDGPARGCVFDVADDVLIDKFLRRKLAGLPIHSRYNIHDADAYSVSPDQLVDKREHAPGTDKRDGKRGEWYFFTPARRHENGGGRRQRAVGDGYMWHSESSEAILNDAGARIGYKMKLSYCFKESPAAKKKTRPGSGWCMTEFGLDDAGAGLVLCKIYVSRHKTDTTYESVMKAMEDIKRRKASHDQHPDTPRPQTQEPRHLQAIEDDKMMPDGSVDPARFPDERTWEELLFGDDHREMDMQACGAQEPAFISCDSQLEIKAAWPTDDQDEQEQLLPMEPGLTSVYFAEQHRHTGDETIIGVGEGPEWYGFADHQPTDGAAQPINFLQSLRTEEPEPVDPAANILGLGDVEEFRFTLEELFGDNMDRPAPELDNYQMDASLSTEEPEPEETMFWGM